MCETDLHDMFNLNWIKAIIAIIFVMFRHISSLEYNITKHLLVIT